MYYDKKMNEWYEAEILSKLKNVFIENEQYIIGCFPDLNSIEEEAKTLEHALFFFIKYFYKRNRVDFYPLYLRKKDESDIPYSSIAIFINNDEVEIYKDEHGREEAVMKYNKLLETEDPNAYHFLRSHLKVIQEQIFL